MINIVSVIRDVVRLYEEDYKGHHKAPTDKEESAPLHDLTKLYPDDVYSNNAAKIYGDRLPFDELSAEIIKKYRGKPNSKVEIYRAVPKTVNSINYGDWVTINPHYAKRHAESQLTNMDYKILKKTVLAKELYSEGNSLHEWSYLP